MNALGQTLEIGECTVSILEHMETFYNLRSCKMSGAILRCSWFFYNSKNLNCIGALSFFTTRRRLLENSSLIALNRSL